MAMTALTSQASAARRTRRGPSGIGASWRRRLACPFLAVPPSPTYRAYYGRQRLRPLQWRPRPPCSWWVWLVSWVTSPSSKIKYEAVLFRVRVTHETHWTHRVLGRSFDGQTPEGDALPLAAGRHGDGLRREVLREVDDAVGGVMGEPIAEGAAVDLSAASGDRHQRVAQFLPPFRLLDSLARRGRF